MRKEDMITFELEGRTFHVEVIGEDGCGAPWEEYDCHGPVSDWTRRNKKAGEWVLCEDRSAKRYYDFSEAMRMAKRDGWDSPPYKIGTSGERAVRAVAADFEYLRQWCTGQWMYVTLHVILFSEEDEYGCAEVEYDDYLGRVEYDYTSNGPWLEAAHEMASNILSAVWKHEQSLKIANRFNEAMECGL